MGARLPRAAAGSAAQGHGGKEGARRAGSSGHGAAGALPAVPGAPPPPPPCPPPGPHSPCCGGWCGLSRRLGAAGLGAELRLLQSPPQRSLIGGRGLCRHAPLFGYICMREGVPPSGAAGVWRGPPGCGGTPRCAARSCSPFSARRKAGAAVQAVGRRPGDHPSGVTGSAEPPALGAEQVEQSRTCSATSSPRDVGRPRVRLGL